MKTNLKIILLVCILSNFANSQTTLKRYKKLTEGSVDDKLVEINVVSSKVNSTSESPSYKSIFDLDGRGQKAILDGKTTDVIGTLLNKKYLLPETKKNPYIDQSTRNIRLIFSIERKVDYTKIGEEFNAYDRIEDLNYDFKMDQALDKEVKFEKWNKYATEYGVLDIGTLEFNRTFTANIDVTNGAESTINSKATRSGKDEDDTVSNENTSNTKATSGATAKLGYNNFKKENQSIKNRYMQFTGFFDERSFKAHQQGTREIDLAGNVSIDFTIQLPMTELLFTSFSDLNDENNLPNAVANIKMTSALYRVPDITLLPNGVTGDLNYEFIVRHIKNKANTYIEHDDKISFIKGESKSNKVTLIKKENLETPIYFLSVKYNNSTDKSLSFQNNSSNMVIQFASYQEAVQYRNWLQSTINSTFSGDLTISGKKVAFEDISMSDNWMKNNMHKITIEQN